MRSEDEVRASCFSLLIYIWTALVIPWMIIYIYIVAEQVERNMAALAEVVPSEIWREAQLAGLLPATLQLNVFSTDAMKEIGIL